MTSRNFTETQQSLLVCISDPYGKIRSSCDFSKLGLHLHVIRALRNSYVAVTGHTSVEARRQSWRCLKRFCHCLVTLGLADVAILPHDTMKKYHAWLLLEDLEGSTRQSQQNIVMLLFEWISRNNRTILEKRFSLQIPRFVRNPPKILPALSQKDVKLILAAAYKNIDETIARINEGRRILSGRNLNAADKDTHDLMVELLNLGGGCVPSQKIVNASGNSLSRRLQNIGGIRALRSQLFPNFNDIFGFYLAILIQTGGNPMAIRDLKRDAVRADALRLDRGRIVWEKPRSHSEQFADFGLHRTRSAPNLIAQLLTLNDPLVGFASSGEKDRLFLSMHSSGVVTVGCYQLFHLTLDTFIQRNELPEFEPKQLRRTFGVLHDEAGGTFLAKRKLNHRNVRTTQIYTQSDRLQHRNDRLISKFQGELVVESLQNYAISPKKTTKGVDTVSAGGPYESVFGFVCKAPLSGIAPGSTPGKPCLSFTSCSTCTGAVIPLDRPETIAKLLATKKRLLELRNESTLGGWRPRFDVLYGVTLRIIETELLAKASPMVLALAEKITPKIRIPSLE